MSRLEVRGLRVDFDGAPFLRDIDLDVPSGEFHVMLGPSGSGKTTLLRTIAGLQPAAQGSILLDGRDVTHRPAEDRGLVLLHQEHALFPHLTVADNVGFGLRLRGWPPAAIRGRVAELLALMDLDGFQGRRIEGLSGGEKQRVSLARALAVDPRALLLDEPLASLDRLLRQSVREDVRRILRKTGTTALFVTHDRDEALALADSLVLMSEGRLVDRGDPGRVFRAPNGPAAARVLGRRNLWRYRKAPSGLDTDFGPAPGPPGPPADEAGWLLVNEEDLDFAPDPSGEGFVEAAEFLGARTVYRVRRAGGVGYAEAAGPPRLRVGDRVEPRWQAQRHHLYPDAAKTPQS